MFVSLSLIILFFPELVLLGHRRWPDEAQFRLAASTTLAPISYLVLWVWQSTASSDSLMLVTIIEGYIWRFKLFSFISAWQWQLIVWRCPLSSCLSHHWHKNQNAFQYNKSYAESPSDKVEELKIRWMEKLDTLAKMYVTTHFLRTFLRTFFEVIFLRSFRGYLL